MLAKIVDERWVVAKATYGFWEAVSDGDDVILASGDRLHFLRQQTKKTNNRPNRCLADYIAPAGGNVSDVIGAFAVSAGFGVEERVARFRAGGDDYSAILLESLADRLAEAFAERLHRDVRMAWGIEPQTPLSNEDLIAERYRGIRPAPGYPACPDHTEKETLFRIMDTRRQIGMELTESMMMLPASSVSGYYFAHDQASYFSVGRLERDQIEDYARRKGVAVELVERWLSPNLGYRP